MPIPLSEEGQSPTIVHFADPPSILIRPDLNNSSLNSVHLSDTLPFCVHFHLLPGTCQLRTSGRQILDVSVARINLTAGPECTFADWEATVDAAFPQRNIWKQVLYDTMRKSACVHINCN